MCPLSPHWRPEASNRSQPRGSGPDRRPTIDSRERYDNSKSEDSCGDASPPISRTTRAARAGWSTTTERAGQSWRRRLVLMRLMDEDSKQNSRSASACPGQTIPGRVAMRVGPIGSRTSPLSIVTRPSAATQEGFPIQGPGFPIPKIPESGMGEISVPRCARRDLARPVDIFPPYDGTTEKVHRRST